MDQFVHAVAAPAVMPVRRPRLEIHAVRRFDTLSRVVEICAREGAQPRSLEGRQSCGGYWIAIEFDCDNALAERLARQLRMQALVTALIFVPGEDGNAVAPVAAAAEPRFALA